MGRQKEMTVGGWKRNKMMIEVGEAPTLVMGLLELYTDKEKMMIRKKTVYRSVKEQS